MAGTYHLKLSILVLGGAIVLHSGSVRAQSGPEPGCFHRAYSEDHLKRNPDQVVAAMRLKIFDSGNERHAQMDVRFANQGHVRRTGYGGQRLKQLLVCTETSNGRQRCGVECDGGLMVVTRQDASGLTFETDYLVVGEAEQCGGAVDLAEKPGERVSYRLMRAQANVCSDM